MKLLYFAWMRERIGVGEEEIAVPDTVGTIGDLIRWLSGRSAGHAAAFADLSRVRVAIDGVFTGFDAQVAGAAEIALFPPVTGG